MRTKLMDAVRAEDIDRVNAMIDAGADVNAQEHIDAFQTLIMVAAQKGNADCVMALIVAGADVNAKSGSKKTALIYAAEKGDAECVEALIAAGADMNVKDHLGETALMKAAEKGYAECVKALVEGGAELNAQQDLHCHETALMKAASMHHIDCVKTLIAAGADLYVKDFIGKTVLDNAREARYKPDIAAILQDAGSAKLSSATPVVPWKPKLAALVARHGQKNAPKESRPPIAPPPKNSIPRPARIYVEEAKVAADNIPGGKGSRRSTKPTRPSNTEIEALPERQKAINRRFCGTCGHTREAARCPNCGATSEQWICRCGFYAQGESCGRCRVSRQNGAVPPPKQSGDEAQWRAAPDAKPPDAEGTEPKQRAGFWKRMFSRPTPANRRGQIWVGPKESTEPMEVSLSVLGGCSSRTADTHADTRRIVDALNSLNARVPGGIQPENIHLEFHKIPNEPDTFLLQVNVPGATRDRAIDMQAVLVAALERAGLKV